MRSKPLVVGLLTAALALTGHPPASAALTDSEAPQLVALTLAPPAVNVTTDSATTVAVLRLTDADGAGAAGTGVASGSLTLSKGATSLPPVSFLGAQRVNGSATDGTWDVYVSLPQGQAGGTYTVSDLTLIDGSGNVRSVTSAAALSVTRQPDTAAPALAGPLGVSPTTVDVTHGSKEVLLTATVTDDVSGAASAVATLTGPTPPSPPGGIPPTKSVTLYKATGTALNGTWTGGTTFYPAAGEEGSWSITSLALTDGYGNTTNVTSGLGSAIAVSGAADTTGPTLDSITASSVVDTTQSDKTIGLSAHLSDAVSGVTGASFTWTAPNGTSTVTGFTNELTSGTTNFGTWDFQVTVPARSQQGTWTLTDVQLYDVYGNPTVLTAAAVPPSTITVTTVADPDGPALVSLQLGPDTVVVGTYGGALDGHLHVTDGVSGLKTAVLTFKDPSGVVAPSLTTTLHLQDAATGGTPTDAIFHFSVPVGTSAVDGTWILDTLVLTDVAGNLTTLSNADLSTGDRSFVVSHATTDTTAPTLTSLSVSPTSVTTTGGEQTVTVTVGATDAGSGAQGLAGVDVVLSSPSGSKQVYAFLSRSDLFSGDSVNGTLRGTLTIPQYTESGTWVVSDVNLFDAAYNQRDVLQGDLAAAGLTTTVAVTAAQDTTPPVLTGLTLTTPTVDTTVSSIVRFTAATNDPASGLATVRLTLSGPGGRTGTSTQYPGVPGGSTSTPIAVDVPYFGSSGTWTTSSVTLTDNVGNVRTYGPAELTTLGLSRSATVTAPVDTTAPSLVSLQLTPAPTDSTSAAVDVDVLAHVTDATAGVASSSLTATSPHGYQTVKATLGRISGSAQDGYWQGTLHIPQYVDGGAWVLQPFKATDLAGNALSLTSAQLTPGTLTVTGATDSVLPALSSLAISPSSVETSTGDKTLAFAAGATDGQSGVASVTVTVSAPSGDPRQVTTSLATGTAASGSWTGSLLLPAYSETGAWSVTSLSVTDVYGNVHSYTHQQLVDAGVTSSGFTVTGTPDTVAPQLTGLTLSAASTDVSAGAATLTGSLTATDAGSGVRSAFFSFVSSAGDRSVSAGVTVGERTAGTPQAPTLPFTLQVPRFAQAGTWTLSDLSLEDTAGNVVTYPATPFPASGVTQSFTVVDSNPDLMAPAVVGVSISPSSLDVRTAAADLTVDVHVTDAVSGVSGGTVHLISLQGVDLRDVGFSSNERLSGDLHDGIYRISVPFGTSSESGTWAIEVRQLTDAAGNVTSYTGTSVPGTRQVQILGTPVVPAAPTDVVAAPGNQRATVSWNAPANGGSVITSYAVTPSVAGVAQTPVVVGNVSSANLPGLTNGTAYTFTVTATNAVGISQASAPSAPVTPGPTVAGSPTITTATAGDASVALAWTPPTDDGGSPVTKYIITTYTDADVPISSTDLGNVTSTTVTGLTNGVGYYLAVRALNALGPGAPDFSGLVTPLSASTTVPGAPTIGTATLVGATSASLTWTAPSDGGAPLTGYVITPYLGPVAQPVTSVGGGTSMTVTGLSKGKTYTFTVKAVNAKGAGVESAMSGPVVVPTTLPGAPTTLGASTAAGGVDSIVASWNPPTDNGGTALTGYVVTPYVNGVLQTPATTTDTVFAVDHVSAGVPYTFTVHALNSMGNGPESAPSNAAAYPGSLPSLPGRPVAIPGSGSAKLTWTPPGSSGGYPISGYDVTLYKAGVALVVRVGIRLTTTVTGLTNGASYTFTVAARNPIGVGPASLASAAVVPRVPTKVAITSAPTLATYGVAIRVVGKLVRADNGAALAGQSVQLQARKKGTTVAFGTVATVVSGSTGVVTFTTYKPTYPVEIRLVRPVVANNPWGTSTSLSKVIACQLRVSAVTSVAAVTLGKSFTLTTTVAPSRAGKSAYLQRLVGSTWTTIATKVLSSTSAGTFVVKPASRATFSYRVLVKADAVFSLSTSIVKKVTVS